MTVIDMHGGTYKWDNNSAVLTDFSADIERIQARLEHVIGSYFTMDNEWEKNTLGGRRLTGSCTIINDTSTAKLADVMTKFLATGDVTKTFEFNDPDDQVGSRQYTGEADISDGDALNKQGGSGDPERMTINFRSNSTVTIATIT